MLQDTDMLWSVLKLIIALPVVILLAYISLRLTNQYLTKHNQGKNIEVLERAPIHNKASICLVRIGEEFMVVGVSENAFQLLKTVPADQVKEFVGGEESLSLGEAFRKNLNRFKRGKYNDE